MRRLAAAGVILVVVAVLVVAQLVLPGIAAQRLRDRLARSGQVLSVSVHAFPAIELLWHHAESVDVRLGRYRSTTSGLSGTLGEAGSVDQVDASATELDVGLLTLRDASLHKRGPTLSGSAQVTEADLRSAVPVLQSVTPVASGNGQLVLRGTASVFGFTVSGDATVSAQNGAVIVSPFGGLATIRVFSDPRVDVQSLAATPTAAGFTVRATGRLR